MDKVGITNAYLVTLLQSCTLYFPFNILVFLLSIYPRQKSLCQFPVSLTTFCLIQIQAKIDFMQLIFACIRICKTFLILGFFLFTEKKIHICAQF